MLIYYILLIVLLVFGFIANNRRNRKNRTRYLIGVFFLLILIASLRDSSVGTDLNLHYAKNYLLVKNYSWGQILEYSKRTTYDIGFCYFCKLLSVINPSVQFFIAMTSIFSILPIGILVYKHSDDYCMSSVIFLCYCLFYMYMNIIRQALAVGVVCIAYIILMSNFNVKIKQLISLVVIVLASLIHQSAILCLFILIARRIKFTKRKSLLFILLGLVVLINYQFIYNIILRILGESNKYERYIESVTEGNGNFNMQSLASFCLVCGAFFIALFVNKKIKVQLDERTQQDDIKYLNIRNEEFSIWMVGVAAICRLLIFRMNIIARFSYYFLPFVLLVYPNMLKYMKKSQRRYLKRGIYIIFILYFIWMTVKYADPFYGVEPYKLFWK